MAIMTLDVDERYPVFYLLPADGYGRLVDVPQELVDRYTSASEEWEEVQKILRGYDEAGSRY